MQILSVTQINEWDQYTIEHEPIASIDLMERAACKCVEWLESQPWQAKTFHIFCGRGNNGGDGLAIARNLLEKQYTVKVYLLNSSASGSPDFLVNLQRLQELNFTHLYLFQSAEEFPAIGQNDIVVDALFGSGLNKPLDGLFKSLVEHINKQKAIVVSIDLPSGLFIEKSSRESTVIESSYTLTFQCMKLGLLMQENAPYIGQVHVLDIELHKDYLNQIASKFEWIDKSLIRCIYKTRSPFAHKGTHGHALLIGGSYGKMGAIQLAVKACLRTGAGLTTAVIPGCGYEVMQTSIPEAMAITDSQERHLATLPDDIEKYTSIGIGPGIGTHADTFQLFSFVVRRYPKPLVIDADGLNRLAQQTDLQMKLPPYSILTPHPKEFERLFGTSNNDFVRLELARSKAKELNCIIVLKSHHTLIALPGGMCYFNSTGNAGLAKGGSGDVLTGIITALLAQGYSSVQASILGVYLHGLAADLALDKYTTESLIASDVIDYLPKAFQYINS